MNKKLLSIFALCIAAVGCTKEQAVVEAPSLDGITLTISASFDQTKLSYTENEDGTYTAKFTSADRIQAYFLTADGTVAGMKTIPVDEETITHDGRHAKFVVTGLTLPSGVASIQAYLDFNGSSLAFAEDGKVTASFASQPTFADTRKSQVIYGELNLKDAKGTTAGAIAAEIKFAYLTSLLKFDLSVAEGKPTTASAVTLAGEGLHSSVEVFAGKPTEVAEVGAIAMKATKADTLKAVAYATVLSSDNLAGTKITLNVEGDDYGCDLQLKKTQLDPGKAYTVARTLTCLPKAIVVWTTDAAGTQPFKPAGDEKVAADWLTCENGVLAWTANETGKPRTAKLTFANGSAVELAQLEVKDFKGEYNMVAKAFSNNTAIVTAANKQEVPVVVGDPKLGETLAAADGKTYTNNVGITGLYDTAVMDAAVVIDYENHVAKLGAFMDARDNAQPTTKSNIAGYEYVAFLPEMGTSTAANAWGAAYNFIQPDLGTDYDYCWIWYTLSEDLQSFGWNSFAERQFMESNGKTSANCIIGITCAVCSSSAVTADSVYKTYNVIYQANVNNNKTDKMEFVRK